MNLSDIIVERSGYLRSRQSRNNRPEQQNPAPKVTDPRKWKNDYESPEQREARRQRESSTDLVDEEHRLTQDDLRNLEHYLDRLYAHNNIDFAFTRHFLDNVNMARNGEPITVKELISSFTKMNDKYGKALTQDENIDVNSVLKDMSNDINCPFVIQPNPRTKMYTLIVKTTMRTDKFRVGAGQNVFTV